MRGDIEVSGYQELRGFDHLFVLMVDVGLGRKAQLLATATNLEDGGLALRELVAVEDDGRMEVLSKHNHPFTRKGSPTKRQIDFAHMRDEIHDAINNYHQVPA